jgi:flagellar biosynthesis/type III secretory pathway chaperone
LGEIICHAAEAFEISYLENCLTSNRTLAPLSSAPPEDARSLIQAAQRDSLEGIELHSNFSIDQLREMFEVMRKLLRVRDVILRVNRAYIRQLTESLQSTSRQLEQISQQRAMQPPEQRVLVQHKAPRVLADLVKGQFHLMQEWLRPILDESLDNGRDLNRLQQQLESMLETYQQVEDSFEAAAQQPGETEP